MLRALIISVIIVAMAVHTFGTIIIITNEDSPTQQVTTDIFGKQTGISHYHYHGRPHAISFIHKPVNRTGCDMMQSHH